MDMDWMRQAIYDAAKVFAPEYDVDVIVERLKEKEVGK